MNGYYRDRTVAEIEPLAKELYEELEWFFSNEYVKSNIEPYNDWAVRNGVRELHHNKYAFINAYVDFGDQNYMRIESPTCHKKGCSFWGTVNRYSWIGMSQVAKIQLCTDKAKEILHI